MRRKVWLFLVFGLVLPLAAASSASAQGSTLVVSDSAPHPGDVITVNGNNFTNTGATAVTLRLNTRSGQVLTSTTADTAGRISATFPIPANLAPGWYLIVATQLTTVNNRHKSFTPGRVRIRVRAPGAPRTGAGPGGGGGSPGSPLGFVAVASALLLLAGGATVATRRHRTRPQIGG